MTELYTPTRGDLDIFADHGIDNYLTDIYTAIINETGITDDDLDEYEITPMLNEETIIEDVRRLAREENVFLDLAGTWSSIKPFFREKWVDFRLAIPNQKKIVVTSSISEIIRLIQENPF